MNIAARFASAFTAAVALVVAAPVQAAFGDKDCSFGLNGVATVGTFDPMFSAVEENGGGAVIRMGFPTTSSSIRKIDAQGTSSTALGTTGGPGLADPGEVIQADGGVLLSNGIGAFVNNTVVPGVERYLPTGGRDPAFGSNGIATYPGLSSAATRPIVQPDGRILVAGRWGPDSSPLAVVVRFNADGSVDNSFGSNGGATNAAPGGVYLSMDLQPDGKILVLSIYFQLWRLETNGQLDSTFGVGGVVHLSNLFGQVQRVRIQPSGKILVVGDYQSQIRIARLESTGALDTSVGGGAGYRDVAVPEGWLQWGVYGPRNPFSMMADGRPVFSGAPLFNNGSNSVGAIVRYSVDLADDAVVMLPFAPTAAIALASGRLLVGRFSSGEVRRLLGDGDALTCVATTTTLASSPNPSNFGQGVSVTATVTPSSGPAPTGSVLFRIAGAGNLGSATLVNGVATLAVSSLPEGSSVLTAVYADSGATVGSTSAPYTHTVTPRLPTTITVSSSPNPSSSGQQVTLTATVTPQSGSGAPVGTVQFAVDGGFVNPVPLSSGTATLVRAIFLEGSVRLAALYSGDATYAPSRIDSTHLVTPHISIDNPSLNAAAGPTTLIFTVGLTAASPLPVIVNYATSDRTAQAGTHYTATAGTLTFAPGERFKTIAVPIAQSQPGPNKDFFLSIGNPANAIVSSGAGIGTIVHVGSSTLAVYINDPSVAEGPSATTLLGFNLSLSRPSSTTVNVDYATADGTAIAGTDYLAQAGTISFPPGVAQRWVMVPVIGNATVEGNRTFFVNLTNATAASIGRPQGIGTIIDDDPTPVATNVPQYRLYSDVTKEHLYTTDANEYAVLGTAGWTQEGTAYTMFGNAGTYGGQNAIPLYRLYHPGIRQHHWTTDANEVMVLVTTYGSWQYEGIPGYLLPTAGSGTTPLYRLSLASPPLHLWTTDANEKNVLSTPQYGWSYEGVIGEVLP